VAGGLDPGGGGKPVGYLLNVSSFTSVTVNTRNTGFKW
jgi:hypothetical protein